MSDRAAHDAGGAARSMAPMVSWIVAIMTAWAEVERALQAGVSGWRRRGSEWSGPCARCGGRDRAHLRAGDAVEVLGGCRGCDVTGPDLARAILGPESAAQSTRGPGVQAMLGRENAAQAKSRGRIGPAGADLARSGAATGRGAGLPGGRCGLAAGCHPGAPVRWLTAAAAGREGCRPALPPGAAGALVWGFAVAAGTAPAAQLEALTARGWRSSRRASGRPWPARGSPWPRWRGRRGLSGAPSRLSRGRSTRWRPAASIGRLASTGWQASAATRPTCCRGCHLLQPLVHRRQRLACPQRRRRSLRKRPAVRPRELHVTGCVQGDAEPLLVHRPVMPPA